MRSLSRSINDGIASIGEWFSSFFEEKEEEEKQETDNKNSEMNDTANEVQGLVENKFDVFYSLKDFISDFWDAIQNSGDIEPEFYITLPQFCGGGTYNVLDLSFYKDYRNYIHGIIAGICYFVYIKKMLKKIPSVIHNS